MDEDKVIFKFKILYSGWELDEDGFIMENEHGEKYILLTNHGKKYYGKVEELRDKIKEYEFAIKQTLKAIYLVECLA